MYHVSSEENRRKVAGYGLQVTSYRFQVYSFGGKGSIHRTRQRIKKQHWADESAPYTRFVEIT